MFGVTDVPKAREFVDGDVCCETLEADGQRLQWNRPAFETSAI